MMKAVFPLLYFVMKMCSKIALQCHEGGDDSAFQDFITLLKVAGI